MAETEYEFEPFERFLERREQIMKLVRVSCHALRAMEGSARLSAALKRPRVIVEQAQEIEEQALKEVEDGFPLLHGAATMLLWGALESAVRDFLVRWLVKYPSARKAKEISQLKVRIGEYDHLEGEDRMRYLVGLLERESGSALRPGVARFSTLLNSVGIAPLVSEQTRRDLLEMAAVRNVLAHRAGIIDQRLMALCPWLTIKEGDVLKVERAALVRFVQSASDYSASVIEAAKSRHAAQLLE